MGNYAGSNTFPANVYQFELTDQVQGGPDGTDNVPLKQLADRTVFLKTQADNMVGMVAPFAMPSAPAGWLKANGAKLSTTTYAGLLAKIGRYFENRFVGPYSGGETVFTTETAHGYATGAEVRIKALAGSVGILVSATNVTDDTVALYIRSITATTFSLHISSANATGNIDAGVLITWGSTPDVVIFAPSVFSTPDLRGEFVRGWDDAKGTDSGRRLGTLQADALEGHTHDIASTGADVTLGGTAIDYLGGVGTSVTASTGGAETRPRNIALLYCIKYE